jgi:hypothetical protein
MSQEDSAVDWNGVVSHDDGTEPVVVAQLNLLDYVGQVVAGTFGLLMGLGEARCQRNEEGSDGGSEAHSLTSLADLVGIG